MKKHFVVSGTVIVIFILLVSAILIPRSNTKNANAVISSDYSSIEYKDLLNKVKRKIKFFPLK